MTLTPVQGAHIVAALLFIPALAGLSKHESARMGNRYGIIGMTIALGGHDHRGHLGSTVSVRPTTATAAGLTGLALIAAAMAIGAVIGIWRARRVEMTGMPELIAMLHSFVGLAAVLVGWNSSYEENVLHPASTTPRSSSGCSSAR